MDLKEIKRLVSYARNAGLKSMKMDGLEFEFKEAFEGRKRSSKVALAEAFLPKSDPAPTLDEINEYIYGDSEEAS